MSQPQARGRASRAARRSVLMLADAHEVEELLARVREVLAQVVVDARRPARFISAFSICVTSGTQPPQVVPALRAGLHRADGRRSPRATAAQICALADVVARADLRGVGQRVDAERRASPCRRTRGRIRNSGRFRQLDAVQHHLQQRAVFARRRRPARRPAGACRQSRHDELLVDLLALVAELVARGARRACRARRRCWRRPRPSA